MSRTVDPPVKYFSMFGRFTLSGTVYKVIASSYQRAAREISA